MDKITSKEKLYKGFEVSFVTNKTKTDYRNLIVNTSKEDFQKILPKIPIDTYTIS